MDSGNNKNKQPVSRELAGCLIILLVVIIASVIVMITVNNYVDSVNDEYNQKHDSLLHTLDSLGYIIH